MSDTSILRVSEVGVQTDGKTVLDNISLRLDRGEVLAVVGPSGSGKTTLLRTLNYLTPMTTGRAEVAGITLHPGLCERRDAGLLRQLRLRVGLVFQHLYLFPHLRVLDNLVEGPIRARGVTPKLARQRAHQLLDRLNLGAVAQAYPRQLSGGEQQRVAILRALMMEPEVLLLDEPTSALDAGNIALVAELLREFAEGGGTAVIVTHQAEVVRQLCTQTAVLEAGRLVAIGPSSQMYPLGPARAYLRGEAP
ncbi:MAG: L-cystine ABC transporter ATP-binding protein YecC [Candidatus Binatia bacterium]|nr:MAG: L-cystine ABC transporter ATP-binding protein YecC [Candidatus Binatia bacterium]